MKTLDNIEASDNDKISFMGMTLIGNCIFFYVCFENITFTIYFADNGDTGRVRSHPVL